MKKIIITGSTGGIGNELSLYLAQKDYLPALFARDSQKLKNLTSKIRATCSKEVSSYSLDLGDIRAIEKFDYPALGQIDGIVLMPPQLEPVADPFATPDEWARFFQYSFIGPLEFIKRLLPNLRQSERAKIVLISGISSLQVLSHYATSNVLRCAWVGQAKTLAHFLGKENIHFNTLSLGGILTDEYLNELQADALKENSTVTEILKKETSNVPLRKYAKPIEVAHAVEALLGQFSDHITGVNIAVDGGFTRSY